MPHLTLALKRCSIPFPEPCLYLEGENSLNVKSPVDFGIKFRRYLDDLEHLKYLSHIQVAIPDSFSLEEQEKSKAYHRIANEVIRDVRSALGNSDDSLLGVKNWAENIPVVLEKPDIGDIRVKKPFHAVVVAAGPSLEREYEWLRKNQSKVLLVCVDASLHALLKNGIQPHAVVATERDEHSIPFFENLPATPKALLVGQPTVPKHIFDVYPAPIATVFKYSGPFLWLPMKRATFWAASSSAHSCYRLCAFWGASSIALVGQDLAFHPDTLQSHSNLGAYPEWANPQTLEDRLQKNKAFFVPGNTREKVLTDETWAHFANDYSLLVKETGIPTVNTSTLGMQIPGISYRPLQEWLGAKEDSLEPIEMSIPSQNPRRDSETNAFRLKWASALEHLTKLQAEMTRLEVHENPAPFYKALIRKPHFLELVLEIVFTHYVDAENRCFGANEEEAKQHQRKFIQTAHAAVSEVIQILRKISIGL